MSTDPTDGPAAEGTPSPPPEPVDPPAPDPQPEPVYDAASDTAITHLANDLTGDDGHDYVARYSNDREFLLGAHKAMKEVSSRNEDAEQYRAMKKRLGPEKLAEMERGQVVEGASPPAGYAEFQLLEQRVGAGTATLAEMAQYQAAGKAVYEKSLGGTENQGEINQRLAAMEEALKESVAATQQQQLNSERDAVIAAHKLYAGGTLTEFGKAVAKEEEKFVSLGVPRNAASLKTAILDATAKQPAVNQPLATKRKAVPSPATAAPQGKPLEEIKLTRGPGALRRHAEALSAEGYPGLAEQAGP